MSLLLLLSAPASTTPMELLRSSAGLFFFFFSVRGFLLLLLVFSLKIMFLPSMVHSETSDPDLFPVPDTLEIEKDISKGDRRLHLFEEFNEEKDFVITATYTDASGAIQMQSVKSKDLSDSWTWENVSNHAVEGKKNYMAKRVSYNNREEVEQSIHSSYGEYKQFEIVDTEKLQKLELLQKKRKLRTAELLQITSDSQMEATAIERANNFDTTVKQKYCKWGRWGKKSHSYSILTLMKNQVIMARVYAIFARSRKETDIYISLMKHIKENRLAIKEANSDAELPLGAMERAKSMGHVLSMAKAKFYDCAAVARKLRAMAQSTEEIVDAQKRKSRFLIQLASKTIPKPLHCLPLHLTTDYYLRHDNEFVDTAKLEDPKLYHYAIFSDDVLATSVVVNSTIIHAKEPEKHVFHIVTDSLNFLAMKMWFLVNHPPDATVHVENIDDFKWLNSSYCSVLRQLESERLKEYYFKMEHPSSLSVGDENLKYRNSKYLSMLNHLRFYLPEVYPKLDKILFLDYDVVVQKDLTPLWSIDMKGMVNGAVETCRLSFHRLNTYLNFSNPKISDNFDPQACGWAFGMNIFDLKEWKKQDITGTYHYWQDLNEHRQLWKLGSLPPGLIAFYDLTYPLDRSWHVLGLGYDPSIDTSTIEKAAVIHYNGNYKPWLDLGYKKYRKYWSKFVMLDNPYLRHCHIHHSY